MYGLNIFIKSWFCAQFLGCVFYIGDRRAFCESPPKKIGSEWGPTYIDMEDTYIDMEDTYVDRPKPKVGMSMFLGIWRYCLDVQGINIKDHMSRYGWGKFHLYSYTLRK